MHRQHLLRGVSVCALAFIVLPEWGVGSAAAQQSLPTIDVGAGAPRASTQRRAGAPSQGARGATPAPAAEPSPVLSRWSPTLPDGRPAFVEKWQLPNTVASVTRKQIERTINIVDTEDAVKYMPSLFVRKRNNGDTQAVLQTRTWGVSSSARSLVYADDLLLTALIGNDNTIGAPRWGLVAPEEIERVDFLYGPYSAQYPGNSMGGVLKITTRMPEKLEVTAKETLSVQDFSLWGTSKGLVNNVMSVFAGDRINDFSWTISGNWQRGSQQPLTYVTVNNLYAYPGAYFATNVYGMGPANVIGSAGNLANDQVNGKLKFAYDFSSTIRGTYTLGFWSNDGTSYPENYLVSGYGPYFGAQASSTPPSLSNSTLQTFATQGYYRVQEKMLTNAAAIRSNSGGVFDFELSASNFSYLQSNQISPWSAAIPLGGYTQTGRDTVFTGTYWTLLDLKGVVRPPEGILKGHDISFGLHGDQFHLNNPVWLTTNWTAGQASSLGGAVSIAQGTTRTQALWLQDAFNIYPDLKFTTGLRAEHWAATDGYNQAAGVNNFGTGFTGNPTGWMPIYQPNRASTRFSPKGSLQYTPDNYWTITGSIGMANRFPTARELYSLATIAASGVAANPNPNLRPEVALTKEIAIERKVGPDGSARVTFFDEEVRDAIINQQSFIPGTVQLVQSPTNVQRIRNSGVEVALQKDNVIFKGLEVLGSATWLNARIISNPTWAPNPANFEFPWCTSVAGKTVPNVPDWRGTLALTYRPDDHWAFTLAARYQGRMWRTMANNDRAYGIYQSFDPFFVVDTKIHYKYNDRFSFDFGVDNIGNYKYFLFHPFPQRTFYLAGKYEFGTDKHGSRGVFYTGNEGGWPDVASWFQPAAFTID
ncbi:TonB-dependent receptor [Methylocystis sp. WRRC1]|uniref:TonB-dependent receptor n=1 Tax=Methylocystis sp. WRRC1 TaxID=1732014 RepID=UPI001D14276B|nr:TonB-dependent receptor [Methylocystis sp. WRRC1]MCC3245553.1 TonB-dependent receptor [Methylocystis sp. WRRC1]